MYAQWPIHLADCQRDHAVSQWDAFKIPQTLLATTQHAQSSVLLTLPIELLLLVIAHAEPVDRLFLALTCKNMLAISSIVPLTVPSAPRHRADRLNCSAMLAILRALQPRGTSGRPSKTWSPCCVCYRYRPKKQRYWQLVGKRYGVDASSAILAGYDWIVESWSRKGSFSYQCPECCYRGRPKQYVCPYAGRSAVSCRRRRWACARRPKLLLQDLCDDCLDRLIETAAASAAASASAAAVAAASASAAASAAASASASAPASRSGGRRGRR
ncbi:hypothetical protein CDD83_7013 [Cordyceps sp. RAO-2017]|nr:hypothetical protein CDD83_7013 [Cordyceps sp. RAO-2017]